MRSSAGSFGARPCRAMKARYLEYGEEALPKSWRRKWMIQRIIATPPWADFKLIRKVYEKAREMTDRTGVQHTVGHLIPLNSPRVCGLHVHENLEVETAALNFSKGNAWCEWHGDLFSDPEQLRIF